MADLNLRRLRYFLALGEQPNFRRAAEQLHITQPVLSRQIRVLETELRVALLVRDGSSVRLTGAGRRLLRDGPALVGTAGALVRRVRETRTDRIRLSFTCGISPSLLLRELAGTHPEVDVQLIRVPFLEQTRPLLDGRADLALVRTPLPEHDLRHRFLYAESLFMVLPVTHGFAGAASVTLPELAGETLLQEREVLPQWCGAIAAAPPADVAEKLEHVAAGNGVVVLPQRATDDYKRDNLAYVRITGLPPSRVHVAWLGDAAAPLLDEAADAAVRVFAP